jgi:flagellin
MFFSDKDYKVRNYRGLVKETMSMAVRVAPNSTLNTLMSNLRKSSESEARSLRQLSSGKRIEKAADDSAGIAHAKKLDGFVRSQKQAQRNANDGISFVQTAEGGLNEISNILVRLRELSVQSASDTLGEPERGHINKEYQSLVTEIDRIAESTSFNGTNVINGDGQGVLRFQVGSYKGEENVIEFDTEGNYTSSSSLGIGSTGIESKADALDNLESLDEAINTISGQRAYLGSIQSRMQYAVNNLDTNIINHEETKSKIEDVDVAEASANLASSQILKSAGMKSLAEGMTFSRAALKLIG